MTTSVLSVPRVDVRLCGSIPRAEMSCGGQERTLTQHFSHDLRQCAPSSHLWDSPTHSSSLRSQLERLAAAEKRLGQEQGRQSSQAGTAALAADVHNNTTLSSTTQNTDNSNNNTSPHCINSNDHTMPHAAQPLHQTRQIPTIEAPAWAVPAPGEARLEPVCDCIQTPVDLSSQSVFRIGRSPSNNVQLLHATSSRRHALLFHHSNGSCYLVDCGSAHGTYVNGVRIHSRPQQGGTVIPHKVRRGSIIRFGGEGAPCFMLKSFSFRLDELSNNAMSAPFNAAYSPISQRSAIVKINTRFNSLGPSARITLNELNSSSALLCSKRSFDSMETLPTDCPIADEPCCKRMRCSSPIPQEQEPMRLVSPDESSVSRVKRRVTFSDDPPRAFYPNLISPNLSTDEDESN